MEKLEKQRQNESDDSYRKDGIEKAKVREVFEARVKQRMLIQDARVNYSTKGIGFLNFFNTA